MNELTERSLKPFPFNMDEFVSPPACLYPAYSWVWNAPITYEGACAQLDEMKQAGILGVYILPESKAFRPDTMRTYLAPDYLTDEYMILARRVCEYALSIGLCVWLYDESGWPSGYAGGRVITKHPELKRKRIVQDDSGNFAPVAYDNYLLVDSLDDDTGKAFVAETHDRYTQFFKGLLGDKIPLMFTDEPGAGPAPWPRGVDEKFKAQYGYDMTPYLAALMDEANCKTEADRVARADYGMLLGELFRKNYFEPIRDWCKQNGVMSSGHVDVDNLTDGCTRHGYGSVLPLLRELDLPGIDVIWRQIFPPKTALDSPCSEGNRFFPRFAASAASQIGRRLALSESFAIYGAGLDADAMRYVIGYQLVRGINVFNFMSASYSKDGGLPLVARPGFVSEIPGYGHLRAINDFTARASLLMSLGEPDADTALYFPARDIWAGGDAKAAAMAAFDSEGQRLEEALIDFDIIDDEGVLNACDENGRLCLGLAKYANVIVPGDPKYTPAEVRARLEKYRGESKPVLECDNARFRARARRLAGGERLIFLFNEDSGWQRGSVRTGAKRALLLDMVSGSVSAFSDGGEIALPGGGSIAIYITNDAIDAPAVCERELCELNEFKLSKKRETRMEPSGLRAYTYPAAEFPAQLGGWQKYFGELFSGEATYSTRAELGDIDVNKDYIIDLGRVEHSARVWVNGWEAGVVSMQPMRLRVPGARIGKAGHLTLAIEVANTLANQLVHKPILDYYPAYELASYSEKTIIFEREAAPGGLYGPVRVLTTE